MKNFLLLLVSALALVGCDDGDVETKVLDILAHGVVAGRVECSGTYDPGCPSAQTYAFVAHRLVDGSLIATVSTWDAQYAATRFYGRDEAGADTAALSIQGATLSLNSGELTVQGSDCGCSGCPSPTIDDLAIDCTGFNLEAFGATP